jgi:two-component system, NtrC family, sensor kinase
MGDIAVADPAARIAALEQELVRLTREATTDSLQLQRVFAHVLSLYNAIPGALLVVDAQGLLQRVNRGTEELLGSSAERLAGRPVSEVLDEADRLIADWRAATGALPRCEAQLKSGAGDRIPVQISATRQLDETGEVLTLVLIAIDVREQRRLEVELRHAQKLESIGQLAAGVAHEINTPMQFIGDNLRFLAECWNDLKPVMETACAPPSVDLVFLRQRIPRAVERALEGVSRVSHIVDAMKAFSHPRTEPEPLDLNELIGKTLVITRHTYKYVAEMVTDLNPLPRVECSRGDIGQVLINLVTNAAYAIGEWRAQQDTETLGRLTVRSQLAVDAVQVDIEDSGVGVPAAIADRIYDPFFTTKPVGTGTGQGLSICRNIIVDRHGGRLWFTPLMPHGTAFHFTLPLSAVGAAS